MRRIYRYIKNRVGLFFWSLIKDQIPSASMQPTAPPPQSSAAPSGTPPQPPVVEEPSSPMTLKIRRLYKLLVATVVAAQAAASFFLVVKVHFWIPFWLLGIAPWLVYLAASLKIMGPNKRGVKVFLGIPRKPMGSGPSLVLWPFEYMARVPKERILLNFPEEPIITMPGKTDKGEELERQEIKVDAGVYVQFGDGKDLIQAVQYLPPEILREDKTTKELEEALTDYFKELVLSTIRSTASTRTWVQVYDDRRTFIDGIEEGLKIEGRTFDLSGLSEKLEVVITKVILPTDLQEAIRKIEVARREKAKKVIDADAAKQVQVKKAEADLVTAEKEGEGQRAKAAAFAGKEPDKIGLDDSKAWAEYAIGLERAKGLATNTKILATDKMLPELSGLAALFKKAVE